MQKTVSRISLPPLAARALALGVVASTFIGVYLWVIRPPSQVSHDEEIPAHGITTSSVSQARQQLTRASTPVDAKTRALMVAPLFEEWSKIDLTSEKSARDLANKTLAQLSLSDDLVKLIQMLWANHLSYPCSLLFEQASRLLSKSYDPSLVDSLVAMSEEDGPSDYDTFGFKSSYCEQLADRCSKKQFEALIARLDGVIRRRVIQRYAINMANQNPQNAPEALDLVLANLPRNDEWYLKNGNVIYDFDSLGYIIRVMTLDESLKLFDRVPSEIKNATVHFSRAHEFFRDGFSEILLKQSKVDMAKAVQMVADYPFAYDDVSYSRLLNDHRDDPETVMKHIPHGPAYDAALSHIFVPSVPTSDVVDGPYIPNKEAFAQCLAVLDKIQILADNTQTAPSKQRLLEEVAKTREQAQKLMETAPDK